MVDLRLLATLALCTILPLAGSATAAEITRVGGSSASCASTVELAAPTDWRCAEQGPASCMVCRNRSPRYSDLLVRCADDGTHERVPMPPGATVSICLGRPL